MLCWIVLNDKDILLYTSDPAFLLKVGLPTITDGYRGGLHNKIQEIDA